MLVNMGSQISLDRVTRFAVRHPASRSASDAPYEILFSSIYTDRCMGYCKIPKGGGRFRWVYAPTRSQKTKCRLYLPQLHQIQETVCDGDVVHGFWRGRSAVTNAISHTGRSYTVSLDLEDFFPTVTRKMVCEASKRHDLPKYFIARRLTGDRMVGSFSRADDAIAEQGLPTSPLFANIAFAPVDAEIRKAMTELTNHTYTRYADDLTISWDDDPSLKDHIIKLVSKIVTDNGFKVNEGKTKFQNGKFGRRIITGVGVTWIGIHPTREMRRKHRAARHNGWHLKQRGYEEWMKLRLPTKDGWLKMLMAHVNRLHKVGKTQEEIVQILNYSWKGRSSHPEWVEAVEQAIFFARATT